ncbi:MAG: DUF3726 domain-containing protein [Pseudomonadota bacterium]
MATPTTGPIRRFRNRFPRDRRRALTFSFNEIESMGKRAARGAGLSWGLAEEAGKAARWLTEHGEPGADLLAKRLGDIDRLAYADLAPVDQDGVWRAPRGQLCPLIAGPMLSDQAAAITAGDELVLGAIADPVFLAPYAAAIAKQTGKAIVLRWEGAVLTVTADGLAFEGRRDQRDVAVAETVTCALAATTPMVSPACIQRQPVDAEAWRRLDAFAQRTFAPATEESRLAGAGAGLDDND